MTIDLERLAGRLSIWIAPAVLLVALVVYETAGLGPTLLVLAGTVLLVVVALLWTSLGRLTGDATLTIEEAVGLAAPSPEEERKQSILRALKDLEYERSVGKISAGDFRDLSARYRAEAKVLLQSIELANAPQRERAEALLAARLKKEGLSAERHSSTTLPSKPPPSAAPARDCTACATTNDGDALFCKRCGAALAPKADA